MTSSNRFANPSTTIHSTKSEPPPDQPPGTKTDRSLDQKGQTPPDESSGPKGDRGI